jgi:hypothetical protein
MTWTANELNQITNRINSNPFDVMDVATNSAVAGQKLTEVLSTAFAHNFFEPLEASLTRKTGQEQNNRMDPYLIILGVGISLVLFGLATWKARKAGKWFVVCGSTMVFFANLALLFNIRLGKTTYFIEWLTLFLLGLVPLVRGLRYLYLETRPRHWRITVGTIISAKTEKYWVSPSRYIVIPIVEFEFSHEGRKIQSIAEFFVLGRTENANAVIEKYHIGCSSMVYFNPDNPTQACLEFGVTPRSYLLISIGVIVLLAAVLPILIQ